MPLTEWTYRSNTVGKRHVGPMAEDFHAAFGLGGGDDRLAPSDAAGIALAAIQGLSALAAERERKLAAVRAEVDELKRLLVAVASR